MDGGGCWGGGLSGLVDLGREILLWGMVKALHLPRRCARVAEWAALEMRSTGNCTGGSNPSISARRGFMMKPLFFWWILLDFYFVLNGLKMCGLDRIVRRWLVFGEMVFIFTWLFIDVFPAP